MPSATSIPFTFIRTRKVERGVKIGVAGEFERIPMKRSDAC